MSEQHNPLVNAWLRLPLLVRAVVGGSAVFMALQIGWNIFMIANLSFFPNVPWSAPMTLLYLWVVFQFFNGRWGSQNTSLMRRNSMRARWLSAKEWPPALLGSLSVVVFIIAATLLMYRLIEIPADETVLPELPWWTLGTILVMISVVAGVSEEAGFRGYMQSPLESRYGTVFAIVVSSIMFWVVHLNHNSGFARFVPLVIMGATLAILTRGARSIWPAIIAHASADAIIFVCAAFEFGPHEIWYPEQISETGLDPLFWSALGAAAVSSVSIGISLKLMKRAREGSEPKNMV
ncbi:MAG: membrane protease YdiL (CAAX protease family) [Candidatus Krumholzibacteriia bacterium]|jgi:membrane protease YdiL (CAAX protease family)